MIRAAAKNHRYVAVVVEPESYDAVLAELQESSGEISVETRHWLANEAFAHTARYDAAISRWFGEPLRGLPEPLGGRLREVPRSLVRREPAPERGALHRGRRALARALEGLEAARQGAVVQQRARSRRGAAAARRVRGAGVRDRQAQQPVWGGDRRDRGRGLREGACVRSDVGLRRRGGAQPGSRRGARPAPARELRRGADLARV